VAILERKLLETAPGRRVTECSSIRIVVRTSNPYRKTWDPLPQTTILSHSNLCFCSPE